MQYTRTLVVPLNQTITLKRKFNFKILNFLGSLLIISLFLFYIFQVNSLAKEKYLLESYYEKITQLSEENEALEIKLVKESSLNKLNDYLKKENFIKADNISYIKILETQVAKSE
ncbi:hypothetical protein J7L36_01005 [bacterium]|nr:hypothetical protein [bacterium]